MLLYMAPISGAEQMKNTSPEEMKKGMEPWMAWFGKMGTAIIDGGTPLGESTHVGKTDHMKAGAHVSGYSIVQAEDMDALKAMLTDHPHLMMENTCIKVSEMMPMAGM